MSRLHIRTERHAIQLARQFRRGDARQILTLLARDQVSCPSFRKSELNTDNVGPCVELNSGPPQASHHCL
jgi:hypothetical protein